MEIPPEDRERFGKLGVEHVRQIMNGEGFPHHPHNMFARAWLAEKDKEAKERDEARQAKGMELAQSTVKITWFTFYVAIGGLALSVVLSIIAIVISTLAWLYPRS
jgi:hypothetical protein